MNIPDRFEHWMETETSYALSKFSASDQYPYWEAGVTRGKFSFQASALNYMRRAAIFSGAGAESNQELGLKVVQSLGKAAHNLVAMNAVASSYHGDGISQIANDFDMFYELAQALSVEADFTNPGIGAAERNRRHTFTRLQRLQDQGDLPGFHSLLRPELQIAANQFVSAAESYGWPAPGLSSGYIAAWGAN